MSMTLWFTRVTPEDLERAVADPRWAKEDLLDEDLPTCYLGKSWAGIQFLLDAAKVNVDVYQDANCAIDAGDDGLSLLGWNAGMVSDAARALSATPFEALAGHYDPEQLNAEDVYPCGQDWEDSDLGSLRDGYKDLVEFFAATAASGSAAIRSFNF